MHPPYDCEDCGHDHSRWSVHEAGRVRRQAVIGEALLFDEAVRQAIAEARGQLDSVTVYEVVRGVTYDLFAEDGEG